MYIPADFHVHSVHSGDSDASMEAQVCAALRAGLSGLCFTDHYDMNYPYSSYPELEKDCFELDMESYYTDFLRIRKLYGERMNLNFGIELGIQAGEGPLLNAFLNAHPELDFVIGSTHLIHGKDPYYTSYFEGRDESAAYREYFEALLQNIREFHSFDVCGHLDYVVRYGPNQDRAYSFRMYSGIIDEILRLLLQYGCGLELNTSPLKKGCRECNPCSDILKRYRELGGEIITVGSDAHTPEVIGNSFALAAQVLTACGFRYYTTFSGRKPDFHKIS